MFSSFFKIIGMVVAAGLMRVVAAEAAEQQQAGSEPAQAARSWYFSIAAGYGSRTNPLVDDDDFPIYVVLDIAYYSEYFYFDNGEFGLFLLDTDQIQLDVLITYTNEREYYRFFDGAGISGLDLSVEEGDAGADDGGIVQDSDDALPPGFEEEFETPQPESPVPFSPLPERDLAIEAGINLALSGRLGHINAQWLYDISDTFNGAEFWLAYGYDFFYYGLTVAPSIGLSWNSSELTTYYYGVRADEASSTLPEYQADEALNWHYKLNLLYDLSASWQMVASFQQKLLDETIENSPLIDDDSITTWFVGLRYTW